MGDWERGRYTKSSQMIYSITELNIYSEHKRVYVVDGPPCSAVYSDIYVIQANTGLTVESEEWGVEKKAKVKPRWAVQIGRQSQKGTRKKERNPVQRDSQGFKKAGNEQYTEGAQKTY